jgi:hypothetical protein
MHIFILAASQRCPSQTLKVAQYLERRLIAREHTITLHDCGSTPLPLWAEDKTGPEWDQWRAISTHIDRADAVIIATPEWNGMATPQAKNFFLISDSKLLGHKAGLIVSVSAGRGGAYPIAELRTTSYKNSRIAWIPEHLIVRDAEHVLNTPELTDPSNSGDKWIRDRADFALEHLTLYAEALTTIRDRIPQDPRFGNGM